ncbi:unnamed protein product [Mytilus coruscus]|uniref:Uncharacterized protein n=1 Tax=Mytilus coruscus TaxID=42192 RepID=A0A6J8DER4_MYTCO|nr:unnamed protein product [Mytilus coruscus]
MDTPKAEPSHYTASTPVMHNKLPAFGLSPISSIDQTTTQIESKAGSLSLPSAKGYVPGSSALHKTVSGVLSQPPFKSILEVAGNEQGSQHFTTPSTATFTPSYVGKPYAAQGTYLSSTPLQTAPAAVSESHAVPLVQNRPAIYSSTIESMIQQPPPAFMTPLMTAVSSAPGSRRHQRKQKERRHSSSSDSSFDREYSRWRKIPWRGTAVVLSFPRCKFLFYMKRLSNREAFIYQFERTAADVALEYARQVNIDDDYKALRKALKQSFSKKDEPVSARRQLQVTIGKSLAVKGTVFQQNVSMIVDTAAMITLVNEKLMPEDIEGSETITLLVWTSNWLLAKS